MGQPTSFEDQNGRWAVAADTVDDDLKDDLLQVGPDGEGVDGSEPDDGARALSPASSVARQVDLALRDWASRWAEGVGTIGIDLDDLDDLGESGDIDLGASVGIGREGEVRDQSTVGRPGQAGMAREGQWRRTRVPSGVVGTAARRIVAGTRSVRAGWRWTTRRVAAVAAVGALVLAGIGWEVVLRVTSLPADAAFSVDGQVVTVSSFTHRLAVLEALYGVQVPSGAKALSKFRRTAAQAMAVQMIVDRAAQQVGIHITNKAAVDQLQTDVSQQYPQGFPSFVDQLGQRGLSEVEVVQAVGEELALQRLFDRVVGSVHPTTGQLQHLYAEHRSQLAVPETRAVYHIVVSNQSEAQSILSQIRAGAPFSTLAQQDSLDTSTKNQGGYLGVVSQAELDQSFGAAAFAIPPNVPFGPVHDQVGWEVGDVTSVTPGHATTFAQARSELQDYTIVSTEQARWDHWLRAQLANSGLVFAAAYRPADPGAPPAASMPTLGPPTQVGSLPVPSAPPSGSAASPGTPLAGSSGSATATP